MREKKRGKGMFILVCIIAFICFFILGIASKRIAPAWSKKYSVQWSDDLGTLHKDISYGDGEANKFDLYLPKDNSKENYGLVVYLHAGGFTAGDKSGDVEIQGNSTRLYDCRRSRKENGGDSPNFTTLRYGHRPV